MNHLIADNAPSLTSWLADHFNILAGGLILLLGLVLGATDLSRLSPMRLWAISSVNFRESIRRKVLWVTPLAMLGVIAITQLSHPTDEQDAIRQATKYCLFASGVVVVMTMLILACTNLPREIENRVIYTVVTKPTTRLEIVLGKSLGFARTAALILLIMGVFSYVYLGFNAAQLRSSARQRLDQLSPGDLARDTLTHYVNEGLLHARQYGQAQSMQIYAEPPDPADPYIWVFGSSEQNVVFPYALPEKVFDAGRPDAQLVFTITVKTRQRALNARELEMSGDATGATRPTTRRMPAPPHVGVLLVDEQHYQLVDPVDMIDVLHSADKAEGNRNIKLETKPGQPDPDLKWAKVVVPSKQIYDRFVRVPTKSGVRPFGLMISGTTFGTRYGIPRSGAVEASLILTDVTGASLPPEPLGVRDSQNRIVTPPAMFRGTRNRTNHQQLRSDPNPQEAPVAIYRFRNTTFERSAGDQGVRFEARIKVERQNEAGDSEQPTQVQFVVKNLKSGYVSQPIRITPESDRPSFFQVPVQGVEGGDFEMQVRGLTDGHTIALRGTSLAAVEATRSFGYNLAKALVILWLLSVLVVCIAVFCSTFVSWPIAVVLTLMFLLGRWALMQIGEASPQSISSEMFPSASPLEAKLFTESMRALNAAVQAVARVLPDLAQFRVTDDIEYGINIGHGVIVDALKHLGAYGGPVLVLGYLFFRRKEVAP